MTSWPYLVGFVAGLALGCQAAPAPKCPSVSEQLLEQSTRIAARAAVINLGYFCRPTDTVEACIDKLIAIGATQINLEKKEAQ